MIVILSVFDLSLKSVQSFAVCPKLPHNSSFALHSSSWTSEKRLLGPGWWAIFFTARRYAERGNSCRPVSVSPSVTLMYCMEMAKDKPLSPPGSPIFLVLGQSDVTKFRNGTSQLGVKHRIYTVQAQGYFRSRTLTIHKHVIMSWKRYIQPIE